MRVFVDLTEFCTSPLRTGIQRVAGELCRLWPPEHELVPVKLVRGRGLVILPEKTLGLIQRYFESSPDEASELLASLRRVGKQADFLGATVPMERGTCVLVPEVFYDPERLNFFKSFGPTMPGESFFFIAFDLLPLTHPEFFFAGAVNENVFSYFRLLAMAHNVGFISGATREAFYSRLRRLNGQQGPVFRLGSDGLGARPRSRSSRGIGKEFAAVGTIEPRKNHALILKVFEDLFERDAGVHLTFAGRIGWVEAEFGARIRDLANLNGRFNLLEAASDDTIRTLIEKSLATIFVSAAEGFGLPPVESLWLGTPVVAAPGIPSLESIGTAGIHLVDPLTETNLQTAVVAFLDEPYRARKSAEAWELSLPTWNSFAQEVCDWVVSASA